MSFKTGPVFTSAGKALHARALAGATLKFTKMQLGDGNRGSTAIADLKALVSPVASVGISGLRYNGNFAVISGMFSNAELTTGFNWNEIGLFAADPDAPNDRNRDILYCYQDAAGNPDYISAPDSELITKRISIAAITDNATNVTAVFSAVIGAADVLYDDANAHLGAENVQEALDALAEKSDIAIGDTEPTDENAELWLDTSDDGAVYINTENQYLLDEILPATVEE